MPVNRTKATVDGTVACHCGIFVRNLCVSIEDATGPVVARRTLQQEAIMAKRSLRTIVFAAMAITSVPMTEAVAGDVNVGVHIGIPVPPPPRIVLPAPPRVVVVPNTTVSYAPGVDFNLFVYGGRYYTLHDGSWFYANRHSGPWTFLPSERVPRPVIGVPMNYYKVPPGHAKKMARSAAPQGPASEGWCPPGHAKKGRC
jgi:hypothetical protein